MSKIDVSTDRPQGAESDHLRDATKMVATISSTETVKPVAYSYTDAKGRTVLVSTNTAPYEDAKPLYTAPPKREPLTKEQIEFRFGKKPTRYMMFLIRSTERAHGIGSDK